MFGAPGNAVCDTTVDVLNDNFPQIKVILCPNNVQKLSKKTNAMIVEMAGSNSAKCLIEQNNILSFDNFLRTYQPIEPKLIIQSHPPYWKNINFAEELRLIIGYLQDEADSVIMTPSRYYSLYK